MTLQFKYLGCHLLTMEKFLLLVCTAFMLASLSAGHTGHESHEAQTPAQLQGVKETVNANTARVPGIVKSVIGGQKANIHLSSNGTEKSYRVKVENARVTTLARGEWDNPSLDVWTDRETVEDIMESNSTAAAFRQKLKSGDIKYEEHGVLNNIKFFFARLLL